MKRVLFEVDFNQGPLGHVSDKPTTVGTNLPDLRDLQGLKGETKGPWKGDSKQLAMWAPGLVDAIAPRATEVAAIQSVTA